MCALAYTHSTVLQLMGLTATVGIGSAKSRHEAVTFVKDLCACMDLETQPTAVTEHREELEMSYHSPSESMILFHVELSHLCGVVMRCLILVLF